MEVFSLSMLELREFLLKSSLRPSGDLENFLLKYSWSMFILSSS